MRQARRVQGLQPPLLPHEVDGRDAGETLTEAIEDDQIICDENRRINRRPRGTASHAACSREARQPDRQAVRDRQKGLQHVESGARAFQLRLGACQESVNGVCGIVWQGQVTGVLPDDPEPPNNRL